MRLRLVYLLAVACVLSSLPASAQTTLPNRVAAGDVTRTSVILWTRSASFGPITFEVATDPAFQNIRWRRVAPVIDPAAPVRVRVRNLRPGTTYYYRATDGATNSDSGEFKTPHRRTRKAGLRFGVSGDARGDVAPFYSIVNAPARNLDFFVNLGDTIYADVESPILPGVKQAKTLAEFRLKHDENVTATNGLNAIADLRAKTAFFATIDDHEVTNDFSGGAHPSTDLRFDQRGTYINETALYANGLQSFNEFHPLRDEFYGLTGDARTAGKRKLYRRRGFGGDAAMFILDARSFRDPGLPPADPLDPQSIQQFLIKSFDPSRTMLGRVQVNDLKRDLLAAERNGITWKFVMVPEPIQNLGVVAASDRFEGYAAERTEILDHIKTNGIKNVVFVAADIHGSLVNNLTYQMMPGGAQIATDAFEVTTGAIAYDAPFGPTLVSLAIQLQILPPEAQLFYDFWQIPVRDFLIGVLIDSQIQPLGYEPLGLQNSPINATLLQGQYVAVNTYGWTEFEIDAASQKLKVTTYGLDPRAPTSPIQILSQFEVTPK